MTILQAKKLLQVAKYNEWYTVFFGRLIRTSVRSVVKVSRSGSDGLVSFPAGCWNFLPPLLPPLVHWHSRFYIAALSMIFFLGFLLWRSGADRNLTVNVDIRLPLFWSTWSRVSPGSGPYSATCAGLALGSDYSYCRASEQKSQKVFGPWIVENTGKQGPRVSLG